MSAFNLRARLASIALVFAFASFASAQTERDYLYDDIWNIVGATKQGGNVASYFCAQDGRVLHVVAGPVNAQTLLREAKWVVETVKKSLTAPASRLLQTRPPLCSENNGCSLTTSA